MNWWLYILIGFACGCIVGLISGIMIADDWWRRKLKYFYNQSHIDELKSKGKGKDKDANLLNQIK